jgi:S-adenosylmethionine:tRNA ribosyltransferase-isomerase
MNVSEFDYELPPDRIAQVPTASRGDSRLMILRRHTGEVLHRAFKDLASELSAGDLLVLNDTKVLPARLIGTKPTGGRVEALLLGPEGKADGDPVWRVLLSGAKSIRPGHSIALDGGLALVPLARVGDIWRVQVAGARGDPAQELARLGTMPLPPYIRREPDDVRAELDRERYQTVFARIPGAVAAPTAGLHFTEEILSALRARGVEIAFVTLHVGLGTFQPVRVEEVEAHRMHAEEWSIPESTAGAVARTHGQGGRVVAVGTTVVRTLETAAIAPGRVAPGSGRSALFIYPGYRFRVVDALVTNFHLPRSTLLMLVCAFASTASVLTAYRIAVGEGYRFYSYGDAMLVAAA